MQYADIYEIAHTPGMPAGLLSNVLLPFYQGSARSKLHESSRCSVRRSARLSRVYVPLDTLRSDKLCQCNSWSAPDALDPMLEAANTLARLAALTPPLEETLDAGTPLQMRDLAAAAEVRAALTAAADAHTTLAAALATDPPPPAYGDAAPITLRRAADVWARATTSAATHTLARFDATLAADSLLEVRAAAAQLRPRLRPMFDRATHRALCTPSGVGDGIIDEAESALEYAIADGATPAGQRDVLRALVAGRHPRATCQIPDVPVPAGMTLQTAIQALWCEAAGDQLVDLLDRADHAHHELLEDRDARLVVTYDTLDESTAGLLARYPRHEVTDPSITHPDGPDEPAETVCVWLVPRVISRALRDLSTVCELDLPLPEGYPARPEHFTQAQATELLTGTYVNALVRLLPALGPYAAATAALGIAHPAAA